MLTISHPHSFANRNIPISQQFLILINGRSTLFIRAWCWCYLCCFFFCILDWGITNIAIMGGMCFIFIVKFVAKSITAYLTSLCRECFCYFIIDFYLSGFLPPFFVSFVGVTLKLTFSRFTHTHLECKIIQQITYR